MAGRRSPVTEIREILRRLQLGERARRIARDLDSRGDHKRLFRVIRIRGILGASDGHRSAPGGTMARMRSRREVMSHLHHIASFKDLTKHTREASCPHPGKGAVLHSVRGSLLPSRPANGFPRTLLAWLSTFSRRRRGMTASTSRRSGVLTLLALAMVLAILAAVLAVEAQPAKTMYRIGVLSPGASLPGLLEAFREGLRDLGYVDGQNVVIEWRFAGGKNDRLPALADELLRLKVDVIFAPSAPCWWPAWCGPISPVARRTCLVIST
jgi:hypothetical protein